MKLIFMEDLTSDKTLFVPTAPSGAGKSTLFRKLKETRPNMRAFSLDTLRHEFYDANDYRKAWEASVADKEFRNKANARFLEMIAENTGDIYVDNTNLTPRSRKFYLEVAKKHGYKTVAISIPVELDVLIARQSTRKDKYVPEHAVRQQFNSLIDARDEEFDEVFNFRGQ